MPVYDHAYKTWEGTRRGPFFRWLAIPKFAYMEFFKQRMFVWLLTIAWTQFLFRLVYAYARVNLEFIESFEIGLDALPPVDGAFFKSLIDFQLPFCFIFAFVIGSGLISRDLKNAALVLYASKPISRWEYFIGKFSTLFCMFMAITWLQVLLLFVIQYAISSPTSDWRQNFWSGYAWIPVASLLYCIVIAGTLSMIILAASSMTKGPRYAGMIFAVYIIGSQMIVAIMVQLTGKKFLGMLNPILVGEEIGSYLFGDDIARSLTRAEAWGGAIFVWALAAGVLYLNLERAVRRGR